MCLYASKASSHFCKAKARGTLKESAVQRPWDRFTDRRVILTSRTTLKWTAPARVRSVTYSSRYWPSEEHFQFYALLKNQNPEVVWVLTLQSQQNTALGTKTHPEALCTCQWWLLGHAKGTVIQSLTQGRGLKGIPFSGQQWPPPLPQEGHTETPPPQMNNHKRKTDEERHLFFCLSSSVYPHPSIRGFTR